MQRRNLTVTNLKNEQALFVDASAHAPGKAFCELGYANTRYQILIQIRGKEPATRNREEERSEERRRKEAYAPMPSRANQSMVVQQALQR
jgi:hypothetical protein